MNYQLDIIVTNIEDNKFVRTDCFCAFDPKCDFDDIWTYLRTHKDMGQKKKLELLDVERLNKNSKWWTSLLDSNKVLYDARQGRTWLKKFFRELDTYAVDNQQFYIALTTPVRWISIHITPKKEKKNG